MRHSEKEAVWCSKIRGKGTVAIREPSMPGTGTFVGESGEANEHLRERTRKAAIVIIRSNIERDAGALKVQSRKARTTVAVIRTKTPNKAPEPTLEAAGIFGRSVVFDLAAGVAHL